MGAVSGVVEEADDLGDDDRAQQDYDLLSVDKQQRHQKHQIVNKELSPI